MLMRLKPVGFLPLCYALLAATGARAAEDRLPEATKLLMRGNYAEAEEIYAPRAAQDPAAALGLARCQEARGKTEQAEAKWSIESRSLT